MEVDGTAVVERLRALPGGSELIAVAREHGGVELVGGAVRDILLGVTPRELDTLVENDVQAVLDALVRLLDGEATLHERFGTALISSATARIDLVRARAETYAAPGALPEVRPGTLEEDLRRRDFTVNAIAIVLAGERAGELRAVEGALEDLEARRLRVLHERSFIDDPTRMLRLARYAARLRFEVEPRTAALVSEALARDALSTVSGGRIGAELRLTLAEPDPLAALSEMQRLGVLGALHPGLVFGAEPARAALALLDGEEGRGDLLVLAALVMSLIETGARDAIDQARTLLDDWQFPAAERDLVATAALIAPRLVAELPHARSDSRLRAVAAKAPLEAVALAGGIGGPRAATAARRWLSEVRNMRLAITGEDLLAAGVPQGPEIGRRLDATLALRLDGLIDDDRDAQLRAALQVGV